MSDKSIVMSYMALRNLIGYLGIFLPVILITATYRSPLDRYMEPSISDYYYTSTGEVFTGILCMLSIILFTYSGYDLKDKIFTKVAAIACILVVFNPTEFKHSEMYLSSVCTQRVQDSVCATSKFLGVDTINWHSVHMPKLHVPKVHTIECHLIFAAIFLLCLGLMSYFSFTEEEPGEKEKRKKQQTLTGRVAPKGKRNIIFRVCGIVIGLSLLFLLGYFYYCTKHGIDSSKQSVILLFETIMVWAFGVSWLTKGQTFYPDGEHYIHRYWRQFTERYFEQHP